MIDVAAWRAGDDATRAEIARGLDANLRRDGFLLAGNHGIPDAVIDGVRATAREFFIAAPEVKAQYASRVGSCGWLPPGVEANSYAAGVPSPPDLKETFRAVHEVDGVDSPNLWPVEFPQLRAVVVNYMQLLWRLAMDLYEMMGVALGLGPDAIARYASAEVSSLNVNRYPSLAETGEVERGQFRIGAHSDFGVLTILHRQVGAGGLQVLTADDEWIDAPHRPGTFAVNIGDMLTHWTGGLWKATVHRVLPPDPTAPDEELMSLVGFCGIAPDTMLHTFPLAGAVEQEPVSAGDYMDRKLAEIDIPIDT